jgi:hypothetical protein
MKVSCRYVVHSRIYVRLLIAVWLQWQQCMWCQIGNAADEVMCQSPDTAGAIVPRRIDV